MEAKVRDTGREGERSEDTSGFEDGGRGHKPRKAGASRSWKRQETDCPLKLQEKSSPANTLRKDCGLQIVR